MYKKIDFQEALKYTDLQYKSKSDPTTCHGSTWGERRYSSYSFLTSALFPQGKDLQYPLHRRLGGPQSRSGHRG
jgi:hypothetical protein